MSNFKKLSIISFSFTVGSLWIKINSISLRLVIFYIVFEIITNVVSPVKLFNDFTRAGFDDIALLSSVTLNQLNNISIIILEVFSNYNMRFSGKQKLFKINLLIMSILRISLKKADDLAFSLYCTETCVERKIEKSLFFSKHDLELLIIPSIMVLIKVI